jgi:hypothetical protein
MKSTKPAWQQTERCFPQAHLRVVVANRELIANPDVDSVCRAACRWRQAVGSVGQLYEPLPTLLTATGLALHNKAPDCFEFSFSVFFSLRIIRSESVLANQPFSFENGIEYRKTHGGVRTVPCEPSRMNRPLSPPLPPLPPLTLLPFVRVQFKKRVSFVSKRYPPARKLKCPSFSQISEGKTGPLFGWPSPSCTKTANAEILFEFLCCLSGSLSW